MRQFLQETWVHDAPQTYYAQADRVCVPYRTGPLTRELLTRKAAFWCRFNRGSIHKQRNSSFLFLQQLMQNAVPLPSFELKAA